jgi:DNA invertase Pin-like site-specific DNA recombinase
MPSAMRAGISARLSLSTEESVSIERQLQAMRSYCEQRGWIVAAEAVDNDVRATKVAPEKRAGLGGLMSQAERLDVIVGWKVDRLARSTLDFLTLHKVLAEQNCTLATVEDHIDLTTPTGKAFATILAVFAEMEAAAIAARAKDARNFLVKAGRQPGGRRPWPFRSVANPSGPGVVLRPIPERAAAIRDAYRLIVDEGSTMSAACRMLHERGLTERRRKVDGKSVNVPDLWDVNTLKGVLLNPALCGARVHHGEPVREADGTIRTDPDQAILTVDQWLTLKATLGGRRRGPQPSYTELLSGGLLRCGGCSGSLSVSRVHGAYQCGRPQCPSKVKVNIDLADRAYIDAWLGIYGQANKGAASEVGPDPAEVSRLTEALEAVQEELGGEPTEDRELELLALRRSLRADLKALRDRREPRSRLEPYDAPQGPTWAEAWEAASTLEERRAVLFGLEARAIVLPGRRGGGRPKNYDASERFDFSGWE